MLNLTTLVKYFPMSLLKVVTIICCIPLQLRSSSFSSVQPVWGVKTILFFTSVLRGVNEKDQHKKRHICPRAETFNSHLHLQSFISLLLHPTSKRSLTVYCRGSIMAKTTALLLLLAVAASQVDLSHGETIDITSCPLTIYGKKFTVLETQFDSTVAKVCFKNNASDVALDCLLIGDRGPATNFSGVVSSNSFPASHFNPHLPNINSSSTCSVNMTIDLSSMPGWITFRLHSIGNQTVLELKISSLYSFQRVSVYTNIRKSTTDYWSFPQATALAGVFKDLSGCRTSADKPIHDNKTEIDPQTCLMKRCDASVAVLRPDSSTCGPQGVCQGNNICFYLCTVTGSTVIDFIGRNHSIPDQCAYSLLKPQGSSNFNLLAGFRERRRKDVTFLDHLILWLEKSGVTIYLEQGGRVRVDDQILTLNTTVQMHHGVELSKDKTGVTAKITFAKNAIVFFDGNRAHVTGPFGDVEGLCGHPTNLSRTTTLSAEKSSNYSAASCEIQHNDTFDSTINCSRANEHCNLLRQAPFTACHSDTDPEHYITACINTLCKYPDVDGVKCQFLEAYAKSCSLKSNITVEGWRSKAGCSAVTQASCQDQDCSAHEFCGVELSNTRCLCRASFASKYKPTNALGEPTVCTENSATVHLARCLLEDKGIDYTILHLMDLNCRGHMDKLTNMVTFSFNSSNTCGTEVMMNNSQVIYKNTITKRNGSTEVITRRNQIVIDFSCYYTKPETKSVTFKIRDSSVVQQITSGVWNYTLIMNTYTDPDLINLVGLTTEIRLNQKIWVELKAEELDDKKVTLVIDSCWATNVQSSDAKLRYDLIKNKCPDDQTVRIVKNGLGKSNLFSFNMFQFAGKNREMFLHCKLELCIKNGNSCAAKCGGGAGRRRRSSWSKPADENPALITMGWIH